MIRSVAITIAILLVPGTVAAADKGALTRAYTCTGILYGALSYSYPDKDVGFTTAAMEKALDAWIVRIRALGGDVPDEAEVHETIDRAESRYYKNPAAAAGALKSCMVNQPA